MGIRIVRVRVLLFARLRELLGAPERSIELQPGARVSDVWSALEREVPSLGALAKSTRVARNGRVVDADESLADKDEVALLPPVGGG